MSRASSITQTRFLHVPVRRYLSVQVRRGRAFAPCSPGPEEGATLQLHAELMGCRFRWQTPLSCPADRFKPPSTLSFASPSSFPSPSPYREAFNKLRSPPNLPWPPRLSGVARCQSHRNRILRLLLSWSSLEPSIPTPSAWCAPHDLPLSLAWEMFHRERGRGGGDAQETEKTSSRCRGVRNQTQGGQDGEGG